MKKNNSQRSTFNIYCPLNIVHWLLNIFLCAFVPLCLCACCLSASSAPGYQLGRTTGFAYTATEDFLPDEIRIGAQIGYKVLAAVYGRTDNDSIMDQLAAQKIQEQLGDRTNEQTIAASMKFYNMAKNRIRSAMAKNEIPTAAFLQNFYNGVADALSDWGSTGMKALGTEAQSGQPIANNE